MSTTVGQKIALGKSGEHLMTSRLLAFGLIAGQLPRGYTADNIYVELGVHVRHIQVKNRMGARSWPVRNVLLDPKGRNAFVQIASDKPDDKISSTVYLIPSPTFKKLFEHHHKIYSICIQTLPELESRLSQIHDA